ncbi:hypothetical protein [Amphritea sp.]|uniref:hypothetical protein n=1 Tax=Amphritea sp. TaxID=1872502 RepID=UPI003A8EC91F
MTRFTPSSAEVLAVPIVECGEPLVDIRRMGGLEYGPPPECLATLSDYTFARHGTYLRLLRRSHFSLRVSG